MILQNNDSRAIASFKTLEDSLHSIHNSKYTYNNAVYINARTPFKVTCKIHGDWETTPDNHKRGCGCPKCEISTKIDTEEYVQRVKAIHGDTYDYTKTIYTKSAESVNIICKVHGEFCQNANDHMAGKGCMKCARERQKVAYNGKWYKDKPAILYYIEIFKGFYKVGITTKSVKDRFKPINPLREIYKVYYENGEDAYITEQRILNKVNNKNIYNDIPIKIPGYTEVSKDSFIYIFMKEVMDSNCKKVENETLTTNNTY